MYKIGFRRSLRRKKKKKKKNAHSSAPTCHCSGRDICTTMALCPFSYKFYGTVHLMNIERLLTEKKKYLIADKIISHARTWLLVSAIMQHARQATQSLVLRCACQRVDSDQTCRSLFVRQVHRRGSVVSLAITSILKMHEGTVDENLRRCIFLEFYSIKSKYS